MRRLFVQIYLAFVGILLLFGLLSALAWFTFERGESERRVLPGMAELLGDVMPGPDAPAVELEAALARLRARFGLDLAVFDEAGTLLGAVGEPLAAPAPERTESGWLRRRARGVGVMLRLPDGRWFAARHTRHGMPRWIGTLALLALVIAAGAWPLARRIAGRLERLQRRVDELGSGDLSARVAVEGRDEVAELARSFNRAAERIERLVGAQRALLAGASHELRSPLARIRMGLELLAEGRRPDLRERLARDIAELDGLIEELLLASRLETLDSLDLEEEVDLLALVAEEAARVDADVSGSPAAVRGDPRLLGRLARNLLENARRHGAGTPVEAIVEREGAMVRLRVRDRGPGVDEAERERIFDPFYRVPGSTEGEGGGVGLGLALVRQIARRHGGEAHCLAREGGGSCFEVELPVIV